MRCTSPRTVGFQPDGKTLCWSPSQSSKEYASFQLPCGKCIECRLEYARSWAVRCVHEAKMHPKNSFITLTYSDEHLKSPKLQYEDFQKFMKKIRKLQNDPIGVFVTGEYGDNYKRPHWHAILFNWRPSDCVYYRSNDLGDKIYRSELLDRLWGKNDPDKRPNEIGDVTFKSAGYVARYAAKKLVHGDDNGEYEPISKKSSKHAIGKKYLEAHWPDVFNHGDVMLFDGTTTSIPRYYEKWFQKNHPEKWMTYVTEKKARRMQEAQNRYDLEKKEENRVNAERKAILGPLAPHQITRVEVQRVITEERFKLLQKNLKL